MYQIDDYDFFLPEEAIAQQPAQRRDGSRLLICRYRERRLADRAFTDLPDYLAPGDLLLYNDTRVFPARLLGRKASGGRVEVLLLTYPQATGDGGYQAPALIKSSKRPKPGARLAMDGGIEVEVVEFQDNGQADVRLLCATDLDTALEQSGRLPLPPYIRRADAGTGVDRQRYQTVYASRTGAVAAPTAGLHFSDDLLATLAARGVGRAAVTLHVGYGTFAPVRCQDIRDHRIHAEYVEVSQETADLVNETIAAGNTLWCVGTTTARTVEFASDERGRLHATRGWCDLYIYPGYRFKRVSHLLTNFHLPRSSLLFLVSALAGRNTILDAYHHAVTHGYRFFSYGDAMLLLP